MEVRGKLVLSDDELTITSGSASVKLEVNASHTTGAYTLSLPNLTGSDTVVGAATAETLTNKSVDADNNTITNIANDEIKAAAAIALNKLAAATASRALVSDGSGFIVASDVTSAELAYLDGVTGTTGSGNLVLATSPTLVTPALGTPSAAVLTNATGLPVATGISGLGTGVATFLATPSSANLKAALTDETGSGAAVFATSPALVTPTVATSLDVPSAGAFALGASVGANSLTIGGSSTTVVIAGNLQIDGTTTTVNSTTLDVDDANITINKGGNQAAADATAGITVEMSDATDAVLLYDSSLTSKWKIGESGSESEIVTVDNAQTLDSKTLENCGPIGIGGTYSSASLISTEESTTTGFRVGAYHIQKRSTTSGTVTGGTWGISALAQITSTNDQTVSGSVVAVDATASVNNAGNTTAAYGVQAIAAEAGSGTLETAASIYAKAPTGDATYEYSVLADSEIGLKHVSNPGSPDSGYVKLYAKNDNKIYTKDSSGVESEVGSGSGSGEVNFILNPNGATALDAGRDNDIGDWIESGGNLASGTAGTSSNPRYPTTETAIALPVTSTTADDSYVRVRFEVPEADRNKKLKLEWAQQTGNSYATGNFTVELYNYSDAYSSDEAQIDFHGSTDIPASSGVYYNEFDADDRQYYELRIIYSTNAAASNSVLNITNVVVGPGKLHSGAVVTAWRASSTPSVFSGAITTYVQDSEYWRRVGENIEVMGSLSSIDAGSSEDLLITTAPEGYTITTSMDANQPVGMAQANDGSSQDVKAMIRLKSNGLDFGSMNDDADTVSGANTIWSESIPFAWSGDFMRYSYSVPVAEWQGSGVLNTITQDNLSEWTQYTPGAVTNWTGDAASAYWRRVGQDMEIKAQFNVTATSSSGLTWSATNLIPSGYTIDETFLTSDVNTDRSIVGRWNGSDSGVVWSGDVQYDDGSDYFVFAYEGTSTSISSSVPSGASWANGDDIYLTIKIPIAEWAGSQSSLVGFSIAKNDQAGLVAPTSGDTTQSVVAGTYTPSSVSTANVTGSPTARQHNWIKVGNLVHVTGVINGIEVTATGQDVDIVIDLPVATANFDSAYRASGVCAFKRNSGGAKEAGTIFSTTSAQTVTCRIESTAVASMGTDCVMSYSFIYEIQ